MVKALVIVESPTKVKTINKILGDKFKVVSSMGHLIDLPKSTLGVDVDKNFEPKFIVVRSKQKYLTSLKKDTKKVKEIYVATDPDREGEAIGWNLVEHIGEGKKVFRVSFQEITKEAVKKAFENPREFDTKLIDAQVARRILDRIVGYKISPLLWKKVGSRLSAGRVQSVALRLIVDREREIQAFIPQEYWSILADLSKSGVSTFLSAQLEKIDGEKFEINSQKAVDGHLEAIKKEKFEVTDISARQVKRNPYAPFITSTMQQDAFNKLGYSANKTMRIAQELYEGIALGDGETTGLITYMRTDSVNISQEALGKLRDYIKKEFGADYLPEKANVYKSKKSAQQAHEAIRPSNVYDSPASIKKYLDEDQYKLYLLIWNRFVASQMTQAVYEYQKTEVTAGKYTFGANGSKLIFDGYLKLDEASREADEAKDFSPYKKGDELKLEELKPTQHFTKPPPRYSDASLVKALEEDGIGRPSTYASIIQTLTLRNYIERTRGYFAPTELGITICDLLVEYFARIMDVTFTAQLEEKLDLVEEGKIEYHHVLAEFYKPFINELQHAEDTIVKTENFIDKYCPECKKQLVIKWGRRGRFVSCSGFPECKYSEAFTTGIKCPSGKGEFVQRSSNRGSFFGCNQYPKCKFIVKELPKDNFLEGLECPLASEGGKSEENQSD